MAKRSQPGFSLVELLVVVAIVIAVAAIATPSLLSTVRRYQLESSARNVVTVLTRARYEAVRLNRRVNTIYFAGVPPVYGVDEGGPPATPTIPDGILQPTEPQMPLSSSVTMISDSPVDALIPVVATMGPNYSSATFPPGFQITFGPVGTIMQSSGGSWIEANAVNVLYLQHNVTQQWAAVTVTPAGRIRVWFWDGTQWTS